MESAVKRTAWNKGLTKLTNEKVRLIGVHSTVTKKAKFASGETRPWNEGLTNETSASMRACTKNRWDTMTEKGLFQIAADKTAIKRKATNNYPTSHKGLTKENCQVLKETGIKVSATLKEGYASGRLVHPNKGKTKENNPEVAKWGRSVSVTRKKLFREGKLKTPEGKNVGNGIGGIRKDLGHYVRSMFEANFCRILKHNHVKYFYERDTFILEDGTTYTPDFFLPKQNIYIELKGRLFEKDKRKMELFKQNYTNLKLIVIYQDNYKWKRLNIMYRDKLNNWEI